ncbi:MAG: thioredoxin [archaeon]
MVHDLTGQSFENEVLKAKKPVIVDFWAAWCGPCKMLAPIFEELEGEMKAKLTFAKIDIDAHPDIASDMGIASIPCLIIFSHGKEVGRVIGLMPKAALKKQIEAHL